MKLVFPFHYIEHNGLTDVYAKFCEEQITTSWSPAETVI